MTRDESTPTPGRRVPAWTRADMPALTNGETTAVVVVLAVPGAVSAIQGWPLGWALLAALPGFVLSFALRARAAKTRPRRAALPTAALAGAGAAGAAGSSLDRYFGLFLALVLVISEWKRRDQPVESAADVERSRDRDWTTALAPPWLAWLLSRRTGQVVVVAVLSAFTWAMAMAATQIAACATPADGGSPHGPQGPVTKAFCGTAGATAGNDALVYALIAGIPVVALIAAVVAIWRLRGGPRLRLAVAAPVVAPASVALAWALAGAR